MIDFYPLANPNVCTRKTFFLVFYQEARGKGLGTKLIEESIAIATAAGCEYMYLMAASNNSIKIFDKGTRQVKFTIYVTFRNEGRGHQTNPNF